MKCVHYQRKSQIYFEFMLHSPVDGIARTLCGYSVVLSIVISSLFYTPELQAAQNQIRGINAVSETINEVVLNVSYRYSGNKGNKVFMSVVMAENGRPSSYFGYRPGRVQIGQGIAKVKLGTNSSAPRLFTSNQLIASMYVGGGKAFLERTFSFQKTWAKQGAPLTPVVAIVGDFKPLTTKPNQPLTLIDPASARPKRRVMQNGDLEVTYPDGTIKVFHNGSVTIKKPDGSTLTIAAMSAQPPTPPSVPPDDRHAAWLEAENLRLLAIIKALVDNDQASINNFLQKEGSGATVYEKITFRGTAIEYMLRPHSTN